MQKIAQLGQPILRQRAKPVVRIEDPHLQQLIAHLMRTVKIVHGVGIAAPQVGESQRVFIVASHPNPRYPQAPPMTPVAVINPKLLSHSKEVIRDWEGCLSIPGIRGLVPRYQKIQVEFTTREGQRVGKGLTGFIARIFQHEYDHINGIVFLDRVRTPRDLIAESEYWELRDT